MLARQSNTAATPQHARCARVRSRRGRQTGYRRSVNGSITANSDDIPSPVQRLLARLVRKPILLPVEVGPGAVDAVADAVELVLAVGVRGPQLVEGGELGEVAQAVLGGLGHGHLAGDEAAGALARV